MRLCNIGVEIFSDKGERFRKLWRYDRYVEIPSNIKNTLNCEHECFRFLLGVNHDPLRPDIRSFRRRFYDYERTISARC